MSTKEEKPQLAGVRLKTRKRNIVVPHDPQSFADAVIDVILEAKETEDVHDVADVEKVLEATTKILDSAELDFSRYGDVLFEVAFAGARLTTGANVSNEGKQLEWNILAAEPERAAIVPFVKWFQIMIRRRPFLIKSLENTFIKLLLSLEFYDDVGRKKIAIALARAFSLKVGILPDRVLPTVLVDRLVARGTVLQFMTEFFRDLSATDGVETLVEVLRRARLEARVLEFFPQQRRSWPEFEAHFEAAGLADLVQYNRRKLYDAHVAELRALVRDAAAGEGEAAARSGGAPASALELLREVRTRASEWGVADADALRVAYLGIVDHVLGSSAGRNQQQVSFAVLKAVRAYAKTLEGLAKTPRLEISLLQAIQVSCYEESRLLKSFRDIVKVAYDSDIVGEPAIRFWYTKGSNPKGRNVFIQDMQPFIEWLDEAEEEDDDDEAGEDDSDEEK